MKQCSHSFVKIILLFSLLLSVCQPPILLAAAPESPPKTSTITQQDTTHLVSKPGETVTLFFAILKVIGSLGLVIGIMILLAFFFKKFGVSGGNFKQGSLIRIMDTRMIAPKKYVSVLQIAHEYIVVGITDQSINLLSKLDNSEEIEDFTLPPNENASTKVGNSFSALLQKAAKTLTKPEVEEKA